MREREVGVITRLFRLGSLADPNDGEEEKERNTIRNLFLYSVETP